MLTLMADELRAARAKRSSPIQGGIGQREGRRLYTKIRWVVNWLIVSF
jgi:hypothetical protein